MDERLRKAKGSRVGRKPLVCEDDWRVHTLRVFNELVPDITEQIEYQADQGINLSI